MLTDPDVQYALQRIGAGLEAKRAERVHERQTQDGIAKIETLFELLADEVALCLPRTHPAFQLVLCLAVMRKMQRQEKTPEFQSTIEAGWPRGW